MSVAALLKLTKLGSELDGHKCFLEPTGQPQVNSFDLFI